jgi:hypothetical protein
VKYHSTHQLDVVLTHPQRSPHRLAAHREHVRKDIVQRRLKPVVLLLPPLLRQLAAALEVRVMEFVFRRLARLGDLADLFTNLGEALADLLGGERLDLGLEGVDLVDDRLNVSKLAVVRVDESGKESHGR